MDSPAIRIDLYELDDPVILVPAPTGIRYRNQVNGVVCERRELEGYVLPLARTDDETFSADWWYANFNRRPPRHATTTCTLGRASAIGSTPRS
jgi:hypothetical protein